MIYYGKQNMIDPFILFQNPDEYINYFKTETEGQYFDRKEVRVEDLKKARDGWFTINKFRPSNNQICP